AASDAAFHSSFEISWSIRSYSFLSSVPVSPRQIATGTKSSNTSRATSVARFAEREITFESPWSLLKQDIKIASINLAQERLERFPADHTAAHGLNSAFVLSIRFEGSFVRRPVAHAQTEKDVQPTSVRR